MAQRKAVLYRMKLPTHECRYGLRAKRMLENAGFEIEEHLLTSRQQVGAFEDQLGAATTPQVFIDDRWIGGTEALADFLETAA